MYAFCESRYKTNQRRAKKLDDFFDGASEKKSTDYRGHTHEAPLKLQYKTVRENFHSYKFRSRVMVKIVKTREKMLTPNSKPLLKSTRIPISSRTILASAQ